MTGFFFDPESDYEILGIPGGGSLRVHGSAVCSPEPCVIHNPSDHHMRGWKLIFRTDKQFLAERICDHGGFGVGHPDPDSLAHFMKIGMTHMGIHGCDGCCHKEKS